MLLILSRWELITSSLRGIDKYIDNHTECDQGTSLIQRLDFMALLSISLLVLHQPAYSHSISLLSISLLTLHQPTYSLSAYLLITPLILYQPIYSLSLYLLSISLSAYLLSISLLTLYQFPA